MIRIQDDEDEEAPDPNHDQCHYQVLNLMLLKFMTMNTEDENRDEIEAQEVGMTLQKSIYFVIMLITFLESISISSIYFS